MPHIQSNERSEAIELISHINLFLENKTWHIRSAGGEVTVTGEAEHMFPDVILYGDTARTQILQGWELKMPDVSIDDEVFVQDAQRKARALGLNSCFIWNFTAGVLYQRKEDDTFIEIKRWNTTYYIRSRADVTVHREDWHHAIEQILAEINTYFATGQFRAASLGDVISDTVFWMIISRNKAPLAEELRRGGQRDVFNTPTELAQPDRIRFDRTVLAAYGIEPYYGRIKETLLSMQQSRHSARQRG